MKMKIINIRSQKGFTLLELIIAMGLSVIILAAIGSIYIFTSRLNMTALDEIKQQQNIRNVTNLISRDASMAGYFGCLTLGNLTDPDESNLRSQFNIARNIALWTTPDPNSSIDPALQANASLGIDWRPAADFIKNDLGNITNFTPLANSNGLAFYYAQGIAPVVNTTPNSISFAATGFDGDLIRTVAQNNGILSLSSCHALRNFYANNTVDNNGIITISIADTGPIAYSETTINEFDPNNMQLMRFSPVVYLVGRPTNCNGCNNGLYRFELLANGAWSPPELLIDNAQAMTAEFYYGTLVDANKNKLGCPSDETELNNFSFVKTLTSLEAATLDRSYALLPAKLDLNININGMTNPISITSAIQSGNICGKRKVPPQAAPNTNAGEGKGDEGGNTVKD